MRLPGLYCQECDGEITSPWRTKTTKFCSKPCANRHTARNRASTRGWIRDPKGYILLRAPNHPMASKEGYVMEHRAVMVEKLGRLLEPNEVVHHINGIRDDNRPENLAVMDKRHHDSATKPWHKTKCPHCGEPVQARSRVLPVEDDSETA